MTYPPATLHVNAHLLYCIFDYFVCTDESNATIHCADVKYSPITFRLAETLSKDGYYFDDSCVARVMAHKGRYEEDSGR